jgi:hypothetical protein
VIDGVEIDVEKWVVDLSARSTSECSTWNIIENPRTTRQHAMFTILIPRGIHRQNRSQYAGDRCE